MDLFLQSMKNCVSFLAFALQMLLPGSIYSYKFWRVLFDAARKRMSFPTRALPEEPEKTVHGGKDGEDSQVGEIDLREAEGADGDAGGDEADGEQRQKDIFFVHGMRQSSFPCFMMKDFFMMTPHSEHGPDSIRYHGSLYVPSL